MKLNNYKQKLSEVIGKRDYIEKQLKSKESEYSETVQYHKDILIAQSFLQAVAQRTQEQLKYHIRDVVQLALDTVFPGEIVFDICFEIKNGRTTAKLLLLENDEEIDPLRDNTGGLVDMASLGLRIAAWALGYTRPVLILDEPMKNLDKEKRPLGAQVIRDLSDELKLQMIIVTHDDELTEIADKTFHVSRVKEDGYKVSKIKEIEGE